MRAVAAATTSATVTMKASNDLIPKDHAEIQKTSPTVSATSTPTYGSG